MVNSEFEIWCIVQNHWHEDYHDTQKDYAWSPRWTVPEAGRPSRLMIRLKIWFLLPGLFSDARVRSFDVVLFWSLDRFSREGELTEIGRRLLNVQEEERRRISRDLHDHLAQRLALLEMGLDRLRQGLSTDMAELRSEIVSLQEQTAALCECVRDISHRLHPSIIEHLGLIRAVKALCDDYQRSRAAPVSFEAVDHGLAIPLDVATAYYRICEEALRNVQKHAGDVSVSVQIQAERSQLGLRIRDAGPGFDPEGVEAAHHLGLVSMRERANLVGAICKCKSEPGKGTTIEVRMII